MNLYRISNNWPSGQGNDINILSYPCCLSFIFVYFNVISHTTSPIFTSLKINITSKSILEQRWGYNHSILHISYFLIQRSVIYSLIHRIIFIIFYKLHFINFLCMPQIADKLVFLLWAYFLSKNYIFV